MNTLGQRKSNLTYQQLEKLNVDATSLDELKQLIKQDSGIYFTLNYYYSSLLKACFVDKSEAAKRSVENLLIRCGSRATWFQGFSINSDKELSEDQLTFSLNPTCNKVLSNMLMLREAEDSNIKISLNTLYQKEGAIFTWLNSLPNGNVEYIHIDENSYLGKIIQLLSTKNIELRLFYSTLDHYKISSEEKRICLKYLLEKNIIFSEDNTLSESIFDHLLHYENSNLKSHLQVIDTDFKKLTAKSDIDVFLKVVKELREITKIKYPLVIKKKTNDLTNENFNIPKPLYNLFKNMTVLSEDYQFGRAYKQYFANEYGSFHPIPIKEALKINQPEILNDIIKDYKQNDNVMINALNEWSNEWLKLLSKDIINDQIELTTQQILSFSQILEPAVDHNPNKTEYNFVYSKADKKYSFKYVLPTMAFLPKNDETIGSSIAYKANVYPEIGMLNTNNNQVKINQYVEDHSALKIEDIYLELCTDELQFFNKSGERINLTWNTLLETKVDGESSFVNNLKMLINYINGKPNNCIPPCYNLLFHIPRITYKNICLSPETWNLSKKDDVNIVKSFHKEVGIVEEGNVFPILTKRKNWDKEILSKLRKSDSVTLYECTKCLEHRYTQHMLSMTFGEEKPNSTSIALSKSGSSNNSKNDLVTYIILLPNLDYKYYIRQLATLMHAEKNWFFIRYWDNSYPSIRVRTIPSDNFEDNLLTWCKYYKCTFTKQKFIPEFHRYGTQDLLNLVLRHFCIESKMCCQFINKYNSAQGRAIVESWFAQVWQKCSCITLKELYSDFSTKGISVNSFELPVVPNDINQSLTSIFSLAAKHMSPSQQSYLYFSLVHMAHNRFYGSSTKDENLSHAMIKKVINRGGFNGKKISS